jgi:hypothetical protein
MLRIAPAVLLLIACLALPTAVARSWTVALGTDTAGPGGGLSPRARAALHDLRRGDDTFEIGVGWVEGGPSAAAGWRRTAAAGPLGTLVLEAQAGLEGDGAAVAVTARGALGPVALRVEVAGGSRAPAPWTVAARAPLVAPPTADLAALAGPGGGVRLDMMLAAVWRIDRQWTVEFVPRAHASASGWAGAGALSLRRAGIAPDVDLSGRVDLAAGQLARHAVAGLTLHHAPRRAPESRLTLWWGGDAVATGPGLELAWVVRDAGAQLSLAAGLGPRWSERPQVYLATALQRPWGDGTAHLGGRWAEGRGAALELAWVFTVDR